MTQPNQMNNLTTLIKRLEAATSRLEDLATVTPPYNADGSSIGQVTPVPAPPNVQTPSATASALAPPPEPLPPSVEEFDDIISNEVAKYGSLSAELGDLIAEQSKAVEKCFAEQRKFLIITTKAKKPETSSKLFMDLLSGMQIEMTKVSNIRENNRASPLLNHLSTVSEGIPGLAWVTYDAKPANFVGEMVGAAKFYGDRVLREYKEKNPKHVAWVKSYYVLLQALEAYVKKHHLMGVTWNAKGIDAASAFASAQGASPVGAGAPPPPPPPPPPGPPPVLGLDGPSTPAPGAVDMGQVFEQLNRGEAVAASLKKVNKSQMTHKNPELRGGSLVPARTPSSGSLRSKSPAPPSKTKPAHLTKKKPPKLELEGNKWIIENFENEEGLVLEDTEINQSVFIFRCKSSTIQIKGKVNTISINECTKTNVVADALVSGIDLIKSNSFAVQVLHKIPNIQVDQCDGGTIYVSEESLDVEVFTSKTTAVNVYIPGAGEDGDYAECAVPEQLRHTIKGGQLVSEIVEHAC